MAESEEESFGHVVARLREFQRANGVETGLVEEVEDLPADLDGDLDQHEVARETSPNWR